MIRAMTSALVLSIFAVVHPYHAQESAETGSSPVWIDFDGDGKLDLYWLEANGRDRLYRNSGSSGLEEVTGAVGLGSLGPARFGLWEDVDRDGRPDLVRADAEGKLVLFKNRSGALLEPAGAEIGLAEISGAIHGEWRDVDRDGWVDLWIAARDETVLLRNVEGTRFEASRVAASVDASPAMREALLPRDEQHEKVAPKPVKGEREQAGDAGTRFVDSARRPVALSLAGFPGSGATSLVVGSSCVRTLEDQASGACLFASSIPALGKLFPLSSSFNIDASGRIGIGTTVPSHKLTVQAPNDDALRLIGAGAFGSQARLNFGDGDFAYLYEDDDDSLEIHTKDGLRITGGSVGIGTLFPLWSLHVVAANQAVGRFDSNASTFGSAIELRNNTAGPIDLGAINFVNSASQIRGQVAYKGSADALTFSAGGPERMRIDGATGRIGIGTTAPAALVEVIGTSSSNILQVTNNGSDDAVLATTAASSGRAVIGIHGGSGDGIGVHAITGSSSSFAYGVFCVGNLGATGVKSFLQPHASDPSKEVRFVCLEGNESGTYFRGKTRLAGGRVEIQVPEEFRAVAEPEGLTVQVSGVGPTSVWIEAYDLESVVLGGAADVEVHYFVNGVRRGFAGIDCVRDNRAFVPEVRGEPFGTQYPEELRAILVENGTLNPDFTPNEATAARLGWNLVEPPESRSLQRGVR